MNKTLFVCDDTMRERGVISAGYCNFNSDSAREFTSRATRDFRIIYLERGMIRFVKNGKTMLTAYAPSIILTPPGTRDTLICSPNCRDFWASFSGFDNEMRELGFSSSAITHKKYTEPREIVAKIYSDIIDELETKAAGYSVALEERLLKLMLKLSREELKSTSSENAERRKIAPALFVMHEEAEKNHTIEYYAKKCNMSKSSFSHIFARTMKTTPAKYATEIKIKNAEGMLSETDMAISEIAEALGFSTPQYFSNTFFLYRGIRPGEYRKKNKI